MQAMMSSVHQQSIQLQSSYQVVQDAVYRYMYALQAQQQQQQTMLSSAFGGGPSTFMPQSALGFAPSHLNSVAPSAPVAQQTFDLA
jgi:hypothetical protein